MFEREAVRSIVWGYRQKSIVSLDRRGNEPTRATQFFLNHLCDRFLSLDALGLGEPFRNLSQPRGGDIVPQPVAREEGEKRQKICLSINWITLGSRNTAEEGVLAHESGRTTTTFLPACLPTFSNPSGLLSHSSADQTEAPDEPPTINPSVRIKRRHVSNDSASRVLIQCVTTE